MKSIANEIVTAERNAIAGDPVMAKFIVDDLEEMANSFDCTPIGSDDQYGWRFEDGSAIVILPSGWGERAAGCRRLCLHTCSCAHFVSHDDLTIVGLGSTPAEALAEPAEYSACAPADLGLVVSRATARLAAAIYDHGSAVTWCVRNGVADLFEVA